MEATVANPLGTKPIRGLIWKFAIPGIITQLVSSIHNIADQVFIGQAIGDLGVAATNIAFPLVSITLSVAALIGMGGASRFSIFLGQKDFDKAGRVLGNAVSLLLIIGVLLSAGTFIFLKPLLYLFGATELIMPYAVDYARIISIGLVLGILSTGLAYFIRADGSPTYSSIVLLSGAVFNIVFDPIFLFGFDMGIPGVALATVLGQLLSTVLAVIYLLKRFKCVKFSFRIMRLRFDAIRAITSLGFAAFTTHVLMTIVQIVLMNGLRHYGAMSHYGSEIAIAASGAVGKVSLVFFSGIIGIGQGCQPIYGYNMGSRQYDRVKETFLKALRYSLTISTCAFIVFQIFPRQIMSLFGSDDPLFYEFATRYMRTYLFMMFLHPLQPITSTFCTSVGKANLGFWMAVIRQGLLLTPFLIIFPLLWGIDGLLFAAPVSDGIAAFVFSYVGFRQVKALNRLQAEKEALPEPESVGDVIAENRADGAI
ncbi:MAG TPA: MATE family efflux transporter [Papillibacter sp.]|nr:MATE family efflux transporter [Papillibacter sp.]